jgi:hypothetical protein
MRTAVIYMLLMLPFWAFSQDDNGLTEDSIPKIKKCSLNGYVKFMQTVSFTDINQAWMTDNLIHNRLKFKWTPIESLSFVAEARNRIFYGEMVSNMPIYPKLINQERGFINLSGNIFESQSSFMHSTLDRLYVDYNYKSVQVTIGRQRINWGQTFIWNPNDLFNSTNFFDFDYEEKPGSDAVRVQIYPSYTSSIDLVAKMDYLEHLTAAALYKFNRWNTDIQLLAGYYNSSDFVAGGGFSGSLLKGGLRGELSYFHPEETWADTNGTFVASLAYDYTFSNSLMIQLEALYNGYGQSSGDFNLSQFYFMQISPQNLALAEWSYMFTASYPLTPLMSFQFSSMYSPSNKAFYYGPSISYSLKENLDFSIFSQIFTSETTAANGGKGGFLFWRLKGSF